MRHEAEALPQLGFLLRLALRDLLGEQAGAERQPADPVAETVHGQCLRRPAAADHGVDPGPGPGDEPEASVHTALTLRSRRRRSWPAAAPPSRVGPRAGRPCAACGPGGSPGVPRSGCGCATRPTGPGVRRGPGTRP